MAAVALVADGGYVAATRANGTLLAERGVYTSWECDRERPGYYRALVDVTVTDAAGGGEAGGAAGGCGSTRRACLACRLPRKHEPPRPLSPACAVVDERTVCELGTSTADENTWCASLCEALPLACRRAAFAAPAGPSLA